MPKNNLRLSKAAISVLFLPIFCMSSDFYRLLRESHSIINLHQAYSNNPDINGNGVTVGILDTYFYTEHPSLKGKDIGLSNNYRHPIGDKTSQNRLRHGSHVTGIILGRKLKETSNPNEYRQDTPYGIAYEADYYGVGYISDNAYTASIYDEFKDKDIKIINNSWASKIYPLIGYEYNEHNAYTPFDANDMDYEKLDKINRELASNGKRSYATGDLIRLAKEKKTLIVFASGNEGAPSPQSNAIVPSYDKSVKSWIIVGSIAAQDTRVTDDNGKRKIEFKSGKCSTSGGVRYDCESISSFSNNFKGAIHYALVAPGQRIDSANAYYKNPDNDFYEPPKSDKNYQTYLDNTAEFYNLSGTSMATPMVSGAAALVQQKFPFLSGVDLANIILSTANKNYSVPKLITKDNKIIYVDAPVPMQGNVVDKQAVKQDMITHLGYTDSEATKFLNNLFAIDPILALSKEEIFGQGILDIDKALKGLAVLDANRLDSSDIKEFNGERQAFYTLDTHGQNGVFENDISQKLWQDGTHLSNALNSPREFMKNADKVGFMKVGEGVLTLAGTNSYEGYTVVSGGNLKLTGELTQSEAWAVDNGALDLERNSKIHTNVGAKSGGVINLKGGLIQNDATVSQGGKLIAYNGFDSTIAGSTFIRGGSAELHTSKLITPTLQLEQGGTLSGKGTIQGDINNISGTLKAGFFDNDANVDKLNVTGRYTQSAQGTLEIGFTPEAKNSGFSANSYDIQGGKLIYTPAYDPNSNALFKSGDIINIDKSKFAALPLDSLQISVKDSNIFKFELQDDATIKVAMKQNPFTPISSGNDFNDALKAIITLSGDANFLRDNPSFQGYNDFFKSLDLKSKEEFNKAVESIEGKEPIYSAKDTLLAQNKTALNNLNFMLAPSSFTSLPSEPMAALHSDLTDRIAYDLLKQSHTDTQISINSNYSKLRHDSYNSNSVSTNLQAKKWINSHMLGGFIDFASLKSDHTYANAKQKRVSAGLGGVVDLGNEFSLIAQANLGIGFNDSKRRILGLNQELNAEYKSYLASAQMGVVKNFSFGDFSLKPVVLLGYFATFQEKFKEKGGIFAKSYDKARYDTVSSSIGAHLSYQTALNDRTKLNLDGFAYYTARFNNDDLHTKARFSDFADRSFEQRTNIGKHSVYYGINAGLIHKRYFTALGLSNERGKDYSQFNILLSLGLKF